MQAVWDEVIFTTETWRKAKTRLAANEREERELESKSCRRRFTQKIADENGEQLATGNWPKSKPAFSLAAEDAKGAKAEKKPLKTEERRKRRAGKYYRRLARIKNLP